MTKSNDFGVFHNLPFDKYKKLQGLNQSTIKKFLSDRILKGKYPYNMHALQFGNAGHCLLLEPERFDDHYVCAPKNLSQRKKKGKELFKEFRNQHKGKNVLSYNDCKRLQNIKTCFQIHPEIQNLFSNGESEVSLYWYDSEYDLNCKARLDWFDENSKKIVDLKFTNNISKALESKPVKNIFAIQAYWYKRGIYKLKNLSSDFYFIFIEKFSPHFIKIVHISENELRIGQKQIDLFINKFKQ